MSIVLQFILWYIFYFVQIKIAAPLLVTTRSSNSTLARARLGSLLAF
jgi:hypothetical protein